MEELKKGLRAIRRFFEKLFVNIYALFRIRSIYLYAQSIIETLGRKGRMEGAELRREVIGEAPSKGDALIYSGVLGAMVDSGHVLEEAEDISSSLAEMLERLAGKIDASGIAANEASDSPLSPEAIDEIRALVRSLRGEEEKTDEGAAGEPEESGKDLSALSQYYYRLSGGGRRRIRLSRIFGHTWTHGNEVPAYGRYIT